MLASGALCLCRFKFTSGHSHALLGHDVRHWPHVIDVLC